MKTLKNKIFAGTFALATLGIFGEKNLIAQNLNQDNVKVNCEYSKMISRDNKGKKIIKQIPCFNEGYKTGDSYEMSLYCEKGHLHVSNSYKFGDYQTVFSSYKNLPVVDSDDKCLHYSEKAIFESFIVNKNTGRIEGYTIVLFDYDSVTKIEHEKMRYTRRNLTKEDIYKEFGEDFAERLKEIINAHEKQDSLRLTNFIKKEYQNWRTIKNENGDKFEFKTPSWFRLR